MHACFAREGGGTMGHLPLGSFITLEIVVVVYVIHNMASDVPFCFALNHLPKPLIKVLAGRNHGVGEVTSNCLHSVHSMMKYCTKPSYSNTPWASK